MLYLLMPFLYFFSGFALIFLLPTVTFSEPFSSSCEIALEKVHKARKALVPYQRMMELARARELKAYGELRICTAGGIFNVEKAARCNEATWQAPERTKNAIDAEGQYLQGRKAFEELFEQARLVCLFKP